MSIATPLTNFDKAEFHGAPPPPDECVYCHRELTTEYFRVDGNLACKACAEQAQSLIPPDSHKAYSRAVLFGVGAAIAGCIGYSLVTILTGWTIGYAAIVVGLMVGKAMKAGSRGLGGRRYQVTAALLTYAAVAMSFVPLAIHMHNKETAKKQSAAQRAASTAPEQTAPGKEFPYPGGAATPKSAPRETSPPVTVTPAPALAAVSAPARPAPTLGGFLGAILMLLGIGLVSPFLELFSSPFNGLIGIFIVFIGVSAAWGLTQRTASTVDGPFEQIPPRS